MSSARSSTPAANQRFCSILVLSPRLRSNATSAEFKPFNGKELLTLFDLVAKGVAERHRDPLFQKHYLYNNFFFGMTAVANDRIAELRDLPSAIIDCGALTEGDGAVRNAAITALQEFMYGSEPLKTLILTCRDMCDRRPEFNHLPTYRDGELVVALWRDLVGNLFGVAEREWIARRPGRPVGHD